MDFSAFQEYMRTQKKSERTITNYTKFVTVFQEFLEENDKNLDIATSADIRVFEQWGDKNLKKLSRL